MRCVTCWRGRQDQCGTKKAIYRFRFLRCGSRTMGNRTSIEGSIRGSILQRIDFSKRQKTNALGGTYEWERSHPWWRWMFWKSSATRRTGKSRKKYWTIMGMYRSARLKTFCGIGSLLVAFVYCRTDFNNHCYNFYNFCVLCICYSLRSHGKKIYNLHSSSTHLLGIIKKTPSQCELVRNSSVKNSSTEKHRENARPYIQPP